MNARIAAAALLCLLPFLVETLSAAPQGDRAAPQDNGPAAQDDGPAPQSAEDSATAGAPGKLPRLWIELGPANRGQGLTVPSGGDGVNRAVAVGGSEARRTSPDVPGYIYVRIDHPAYTGRPRDVYLTVESYDDGFRWIPVQYDKAAPKADRAARYTKADRALLHTGQGRWVRQHVFLPQVRFGHGQNNRADLRLAGSGLYVRRIELSAQPPANYDPAQVVDPATLKQLAIRRPTGMELTFGNDATEAEAAVLAALSVTSVESYVDWAGVEPQARGGWDFQQWDRQVGVLRDAGLRWVPFLIAGPPYATPLWFQHGPDCAYYKCLEHHREHRAQSLFNPALPAEVDRFIGAFARRYRDSGAIESVLLGITGIYGESIYPAGPDGGGWTARLVGPYHNHRGWWAADPHAVASFRQAMRRKYATPAALAAAWGTAPQPFEKLNPMLPADATNDRAAADMAGWYVQSMTDWAEYWVETTRRHFPQTEIYLCTGGNGASELGADFTAQAKAIARHGAGIRITNEASDYAHNFAVTREVATATRFYKTFCGFEPAGKVDPLGAVARVYNATASGARQLHYYQPNVLSSTEALTNFRANAHWLTPREPIVDVAVYVPRETWEIDPEQIDRFYRLVPVLRDVSDMDLVTRCSVADGILHSHRALLLAGTEALEPAAAEKIEQWVHGGGLLIVAMSPGETPASRLTDLPQWRDRLLPPAAESSVPQRYRLDAPAPRRWQLAVGDRSDADWLFGHWHNSERAGMWPKSDKDRMRWTGDRAGVRLPVQQGKDYLLRLDVVVPSEAMAGKGVRLAIDGKPLGVLDKPGRQVAEFRVPAAMLAAEEPPQSDDVNSGAGEVAELSLRCQGWSPARQGQGDTRRLGVAVRQVEWVQDGAGDAAPGSVGLQQYFDPADIARRTRRVGQGLVVDLSPVELDGADDQVERFARLAAELLAHTGRYLPGAEPICPGDARLDGRYATRLSDGSLLWYDRAGRIEQQRVGQQQLPQKR